jgi:hypothetical protein
MSEREPASAEFAPQRLSGGRRRIDPLAIGALVVVAGIGLAVIKPWGGDPSMIAEASAIPASMAPEERPTVEPRASASTVADAPYGLDAPLLDWPEADAALQPRADWGIRTLVVDPEPPPDVMRSVLQVVERWTGIETDREPVQDVELGSSDREILALGLTYPDDEAPLDARLWRAVDGGWEWLAADRLGPPDDGTMLFSPPRVGGAYLATWPPGRYLAEWLGPDGIDGVTFRIEGRFQGAEPGLAQLKPPDRDLPSPLRPDFRVEEGDRLFAVSRGIAEGLPAPGTIPLDAARAWRETLARPSTPVREVAAAFLPEANGLGVLLPPDARGANGAIVSLGPDPGTVDAQRVIGIRFLEDERSPYVIFRAPDGGSWLPGVYRLDVSWTGVEGPRRTSYHVEVRPGP